MSFLLGFIIGTLFFLVYVFLSPGLKGIAFRPDSSNKMKFSPQSIVSLMIHPFHNSFLWNPSLLTCNWIIISCFFGLLFYLI